jgi:hypothetical protein
MSSIIGPVAAKAVLDALMPSIEASLEAARGASAAVRIAAIEAAKTKLSDFFNSTRAQNLADPEEVEAVGQIDSIAHDALSKLTVDQVDLAVDAIEQASQKLKTLGATLDQTTATTASAAKSVALQPVKKAVDTMTAMVNSVKALKANLSGTDPDQAKAASEIDKLVAQFEALRAAVSG